MWFIVIIFTPLVAKLVSGAKFANTTCPALFLDLEITLRQEGTQNYPSTDLWCNAVHFMRCNLVYKKSTL